MNTTAGPSLVLDPVRESLVSSAGGLLLHQTLRRSGLTRALSTALRPWRARRAIHDPGKILADVAVAVALGGDCLADLAVVRAQPHLFGRVASDPTVSRLINTLAHDLTGALPAIRSARAHARAAVRARQRPLDGQPGTRDGGRSSWTSTPRCWTRTPTNNTPHPPTNAGSGSRRCARSSTTASTAPGKPSWHTYARPRLTLEQTRPHHRTGPRAGATTRPRTSPSTGAHRFRRVLQAFLHHVTDLGLEYSRFSRTRDGQSRAGGDPDTGMARRDRQRRPPARRRPGRGSDRVAARPGPGHPPRPPGLATRDAGDRPPGTPTPRRATTADRPRRMADHLLRHQHPRTRLDPRHPGTTPPATRPRRRPHPRTERHRNAQPALPQLHRQPDLAGDRRAGRRPARLDPNPRLAPA